MHRLSSKFPSIFLFFGIVIAIITVVVLLAINRNKTEILFVYTSRAKLHNQFAHFDEAITNFNAAIELAPNDPKLYLLRAQTYLLLYEWDKVLADCNKAIELDPTYAEAYYQRGLLYYSILQAGSSLYEEALADFQRYLDLAPDGEHAEQASRYTVEIAAQQGALGG